MKSDVEAILAQAPPPTSEESLRKLHVVLLAGPKDHGKNEHDYPLWQQRWKVLLAGNSSAKAANGRRTLRTVWAATQ